MIKLSAIPDGKEDSLSSLGTMRAVPGVLGKGIKITKQVKIKSSMKRIKMVSTPVYTKRDLVTVFSAAEKTFFVRKISGAVGNRKKAKAKGYVVHTVGGQTARVPVYELKAYPSAFHQICGYIATDIGYVAVTKRKTILWPLLGFITSFGVMVSLFIYRFGADISFTQLMVLLGIY